MSMGESTTAVAVVEVDGGTVMVVVVGAELAVLGLVWTVQATRAKTTGHLRVSRNRDLAPDRFGRCHRRLPVRNPNPSVS